MERPESAGLTGVVDSRSEAAMDAANREYFESEVNRTYRVYRNAKFALGGTLLLLLSLAFFQRERAFFMMEKAGISPIMLDLICTVGLLLLLLPIIPLEKSWKNSKSALEAFEKDH